MLNRVNQRQLTGILNNEVGPVQVEFKAPGKCDEQTIQRKCDEVRIT